MLLYVCLVENSNILVSFNESLIIAQLITTTYAVALIHPGYSCNICQLLIA